MNRKMAKIKPAVNKRVLLFLAGFMWLGVGAMLLFLSFSWLNAHRDGDAYLFGGVGAIIRAVSAPFWILENRGQKFGANIADGRDEVRFFLYNVEKLYHRGRNGGIGSLIREAFPDTKIVFIDFIHWNWSGTFVVECPLPAGPSQSN